MKRILTFALLVAASFSLTNCAQKEAYVPVQEEVGKSVSFQFVAELASETKTYNAGMSTMWSEGDSLKLSYTFEALGQTYAGDLKTPFVTAKGDGVFAGNIDFGDFLTSLGDLTGKMKFSAVYPFTEEGGIVFPKSTVQEGYNNTAHLAGANCPLYGDVDIELSLSDLFKGQISTPKIRLNHATSVIAVEVTNNSKEPIVIERVSFGVGSDVKASTVVENGASLPVGEKATVYVVVEPNTVNPKDGTIKFWVNDTPQDINVVNPVVFKAGEIRKMNFNYEGDFPELYAVADIAAEMTADRIVPSVKTLIDYNYLKEWAANLKAQEDIEDLLQDVLVAIVARDLDKAYEVLGGIPGFEHQFEVVTGQARYIEKVNYEVSDYLDSFVEDIKKIEDIESLLNILDQFMRYYEVSGTKDQILGGVGKLSDYISDFSDMITDWTSKYVPEWASGLSWIIEGIVAGWLDDLAEMLDFNIIDLLAQATADPDGISARILNWMFDQTEIRNAILDKIVDIIKGIEDASKDYIDGTNEGLKQAGILSARTTAIYQAKIAAHKAIEENFIKLNQAELDKLNNSVWGIFRMILDWDRTKAVFEDLQITKVYDVFQQIAQVIENVVVYEEGPYQIVSEPEVEDVPVLTPSELAVLIAE